MIEVEPGVEIEAFLTRPSKVQHNVLLVMPHGGPIGVQEYNHFNPEVQYYVSRGFSVLRVNFRGSSGFGKTFQKSGVGQFGQQIEHDISAAVSKVTSRYKFDKMCAIGASYGGYSSIMLAIKHPDSYDCVVAAYGIYDLPLLYNTSNTKISDEHRLAVTKTVGEYSTKLTAVSPVYLSEKINLPVLLIAGKADEISGFEQSHRMYYMLKRAGKPVETLFYKNTGHGHLDWWGDRHESAFTVDYLHRTLNLKPLWPPATTQAGEITQTLGDDLSINSDGYNFSTNNVTNNKDKAIEYYQQAIALQHAPSMYRLGQMKLAELDPGSSQLKTQTGPAVEWLQQASEHGHYAATYHLGDDLLFGRYVEKDWPKSYQLFKLAAEQNTNPYDYNPEVNMAYMLCLGKGVT
jgi:pimeloyl-ACP methyl ester carboxylesterase